MDADFLVALAQAGHFAREAFDGPARAIGAAHLIDIREIAGIRDRQAEIIADGLALFEVGVGEIGRGRLNRLVVVLGQRPTHYEYSTDCDYGFAATAPNST